MQREPKPQTQDKLEPVYFCFVFEHGQAAYDFALSVIRREFAVDIGYVPERSRWQVSLRQKMLPLHQDIKVLLADLSERAARFGGERDGWGKSSQ
jgi:Regulator of ribonuclease activity B